MREEPREVHDSETDGYLYCPECGEVVYVIIFAQRDEAEGLCPEGHLVEVDVEALL